MNINRLFAAAVLAIIASGCANFQFVSAYDEVIDKGITDFSEQFNAFVRDMGDSAGKVEGTYDANTKRYNALAAKLDVLIFRASTASAGKGCRIEKKVYDRIEQALGNDIPPSLRPESQAAAGNADGCNTRLLELVQKQLDSVRKIHSETDKCPSSTGTQVTCIRPATAKTIAQIVNQSINAVAVVESAKKGMNREN
jgi:hypothetical protein